MSEVVSDIRTMVATLVEAQPGAIGLDASLGELPGWGSLPALQLLAMIEKRFGVALEVREFLRLGSVVALADAVVGRLGTSRAT